MKHAIVSIAVAWILIGLISAVPFIFNGINPIDAYFESVSGWSGTGLSMIPEPEKLPFSLNFWRGFIQWLGGFGIVLMALLFYERPETMHHLFAAEGRSEEFSTSIPKIALTIVKIYVLYTLIGVALFSFSGLSLFDAVIHSFTSIATGGFSTNSTGVGIYGLSATLTCILLMLLGGISFESHYELTKLKFGKFFSNPEVRFFFGIIILSTVLILVNVFFSGKNYILDSFFYVVSAITGTGATTAVSVSSLPALSIFILIIVMVFGSCYGSTTGALKLWRIIILYKVIRREIHKVFLPPNSIMQIKMGDKVVSDESALKALSYMALYVSLIVLGSIIFMLFGYGVVDSIFTVASAQGNVGLNSFFGSDWFNMNPLLKVLLSLHMLVGRMEIIPLLVLFKGIGIGKRII
jgi:trk system potassium uptake protein TrkH